MAALIAPASPPRLELSLYEPHLVRLLILPTWYLVQSADAAASFVYIALFVLTFSFQKSESDGFDGDEVPGYIVIPLLALKTPRIR